VCPKCSRRLPSEAPELDGQDRELFINCPACKGYVFLCLDWDGNTNWWGRVREVHAAPVGDGTKFHSWCLNRLSKTRHAVVRKCAAGHMAYFCASQREVKSIREMLKQRNYYAYSWLILGKSGGMSLSYEFGGSGRALNFMCSALQSGLLRICLPL
jgi:hypothetical protein